MKRQTNYKHETNGNSRTESIITKMKKSLNELKSRLEITEKRISKLEDRSIEIQFEEERARGKTNEQNSVPGHDGTTSTELVLVP